MAKKPSRSSSSKRLEALLRAQRMNELLKIGGVQSQALLDSAGESRPTDETHVADLLESERFKRSETSLGSGSKRSRKKKASAKRSKGTAKKKRRK